MSPPASRVVVVASINHSRPGVVPDDASGGRCSPRSTPSSARSPRRCAVRCGCSPAPARARPGRSPTGSPTASPPASTRRPRCWRSRSPPGRQGRCGPGCAGSARRRVQARTFHSAALRQLRYFWPHVYGTELPTLTESKIGLLATAARRQRVNADQALLRDLASEVEWAKVSNVASRRLRRVWRRPAAARWPDSTLDDRGAGLRQLRGGQARPGPDGHGGRPAAHRRAARRRRAGGRPGPPAVQMVRRRRVPGRLAAPVGAARPVARRPRRAVRGRRPGADDLLLRRRRRRLPHATSRRSTPAPPRSSWSATTAPPRRWSPPPTRCSPGSASQACRAARPAPGRPRGDATPAIPTRWPRRTAVAARHRASSARGRPRSARSPCCSGSTPSPRRSRTR